jgi:ribosome-interacting GTPase 1
MSEPTYEELKAKLSQLEKEVETKKRSGDLIFKVGEKGGAMEPLAGGGRRYKEVHGREQIPPKA